MTNNSIKQWLQNNNLLFLGIRQVGNLMVILFFLAGDICCCRLPSRQEAEFVSACSNSSPCTRLPWPRTHQIFVFEVCEMNSNFISNAQSTSSIISDLCIYLGQKGVSMIWSGTCQHLNLLFTSRLLPSYANPALYLVSFSVIVCHRNCIP